MDKRKMNMDIEENEKKSPGFFSKLFLLWVLPILYSIGLGVAILHFAGVSISTQMKWLDKHSEQVFTQQEKPKIDVASGKKDSSDNQSIEKNIEKQEETTLNLSDSKEDKDLSKDGEVPDLQEKTNSLVGETFMDLDSREAAKLIMNMSEADALMVLRELSVDIRSSIISEMPEDAGARYTIALVNGTDVDTTTNSPSQIYKYMKAEQIATVLMGIKSKEEILRQIRNLDPQKASEVIAKLDPEIAGWIITRMN